MLKNSSALQNQTQAKPPENSSIFIQNRENTTITGVQDLVKYNQNEIVVQTTLGLVLITGTDMVVEKLDVETKELTFIGKVISLIYSNAKQEKKSFFKRLIN